jgi:hypothetical protein
MDFVSRISALYMPGFMGCLLQFRWNGMDCCSGICGNHLAPCRCLQACTQLPGSLLDSSFGIPPFLAITLSMLILNILFSFASWAKFMQLCAMGIMLTFMQVSLSLFAGYKLKSSIGWIVFSLLAIIFLPLLIPLYTRYWSFIAAVSVLTCMLFWLAMRKWSKTEFDFVVH